MLTRADRRRITAIYYMNKGWKSEDGGVLRIHEGKGEVGGKYRDVAPLGDRLVLFLSDLLHEVLPSHAPRIALSGWLYSPSEARPLLAEMPRRSQDDTIFVSIPAYRDVEAQYTIIDLFEKVGDLLQCMSVCVGPRGMERTRCCRCILWRPLRFVVCDCKRERESGRGQETGREGRKVRACVSACPDAAACTPC